MDAITNRGRQNNLFVDNHADVVNIFKIQAVSLKILLAQIIRHILTTAEFIKDHH